MSLMIQRIMSHIDSKDVEIYERDKKITIEFIDEIFKKHALKIYITPEEDALTEKVTRRANLTAEIRFKLESIITQGNFDKFKESIKDFGFVHDDIMIIYANILVQEILDSYETF